MQIGRVVIACPSDGASPSFAYLPFHAHFPVVIITMHFKQCPVAYEGDFLALIHNISLFHLQSRQVLQFTHYIRFEVDLLAYAPKRAVGYHCVLHPEVFQRVQILHGPEVFTQHYSVSFEALLAALMSEVNSHFLEFFWQPARIVDSDPGESVLENIPLNERFEEFIEDFFHYLNGLIIKMPFIRLEILRVLLSKRQSIWNLVHY